MTRHRPSPATTISIVALFVALGGTGYAALSLPHNSVGTAQLRHNAVTSSKVRNRSLKAVDFATGQLPAGTTGLQGPKGDKGEPGPSTGSAGGDLSGSYPNPAIAAGAVGNTKLAAGAVTPGKIAGVPTVRVVNNTNQTIPHGVFTPLTFASEDFDPQNMHSAAQPTRLTAPIAGAYLVTAQMAWETNTNGSRSMILYKNGTEFFWDQVVPTSFFTNQSIATVIGLAAGDYVEVDAETESPSDLLSEASGGFQPQATMTWIAPIG
jgi:hypothetical protein